MFYDKFEALCAERGISVTRAILEIGLSRSIGTKWKREGTTPNGKTLAKVSAYFGVPTDYFTRDQLADAILIAMKSAPGYVDPLDSITGIEADDDLAEYLTDLRDRPETRALLEASRGMTKEQVEAMAAFAKKLRGNDD